MDSDFSWLGRCFVILDNLVNSDRAKHSEIPLFFYPNAIDIDIQVQSFLVFLAITAVAEHCTESPISVVELQNVKMAYKFHGEYKIILAGKISDSSKALVHSLELIYECFIFNNGGFEFLESKAKDRKALQELISDAGSLLIPLIENFHDSVLKFSPMPYLKVSPQFRGTSAHFVQAWQLINSMMDSPLSDVLYGAALIFNHGVVYTQLDMMVTRWIINYIQYLDSNQVSGGPKYSLPELAHGLTTRIFFAPVFLKQHLVSKANVSRRPDKVPSPSKLLFFSLVFLAVFGDFGTNFYFLDY
jgi:hypothetical protein